MAPRTSCTPDHVCSCKPQPDNGLLFHLTTAVEPPQTPSLQLGQLDAACPGMWSSPPVCFPPCYAILSAIAPACRTELLSWENGLNTVQIQYGQPAYWLW